MNYLRQTLLDETYIYNDNKTAFQMTKSCLTHMMTYGHQLFEFQKYTSTKSSSFTDMFEEAYFQGICGLVSQQSMPCQDLMNGNLAHGMVYVQRHIFNWMDEFVGSMEGDIPGVRSRIKPNDPNIREIEEIDYSMKNYVREAISKLIKEERIEMKKFSDSLSRIFLILLVVYIICLLIFYAAWAYPTASKFNTEIKVTFKMLNMIPVSVIRSIEPIRVFLERWTKSSTKHCC